MRSDSPMYLGKTARLLGGVLALVSSCVPVLAASLGSTEDASQDDGAELEALLEDERKEADSLRRHGRFNEALRLVNEHLDEEPGDWKSRAIRGRVWLDQADLDRGRKDLEQAFESARTDSHPGGFEIGLDLAGLELLLGHAKAALARITGLIGESSRRDFLTGQAWLAVGDQGAALDAFDAARIRSAEGDRWRDFLFRARCERALGQLEAASQSLVTADRLAGGSEAEVLVELADVYLESDGEVAKAGSSKRLPGKLYREALELSRGHEGALLGLFRLHDLNWRRGSQSARSFLDELLKFRPNSLLGQIALATDHLKNGELQAARTRISSLELKASGRRDVRALGACLLAVSDQNTEASVVLTGLVKSAPWDSAPERLCGEVLIALYRFEEALVYLKSATERNPTDWRGWTRLGEALANTGAEEAAASALLRAKDMAAGRQDAWRNNLSIVLAKIASRWVVTEGSGRLSFALPPVGHAVLRRLFEPFYAKSRESLAQRYGFTPGPVRIEVFDIHGDFSVRSTGFEGFPALGVCFGPVVTALSPLSELRGSFSWAETSYHEFSHVIHLGLTKNRCPRWITEGLATWEEEQLNPSWTRNLRRELVDSVAGGGIIGVRDLNRAFRGPRIIWAYYQGKLMCDLLIERFGFPAMVDLLGAFNDGADLDGALELAFSLSPEELDSAFFTYTQQLVASLHVEPRRDPSMARVLAFSLGRVPPEDESELGVWKEGWCTVAWSAWQAGRIVDAEEALRRLRSAGLNAPRAEFLRGELALSAGEEARAIVHLDAGFAMGGEDYRARMARAALAAKEGDREGVLRHLSAAEAAFAGWDEAGLSAELALVRYYEEEGDEARAMAARERWLRWNAGDLQERLVAGRFRLERLDSGDAKKALELFTGAVEVDPFRAEAHVGRAAAFLALGQTSQAREALEIARLVPPELDSEFGAGPIAAGPLNSASLAKAAPRIEARRETIDALFEALSKQGSGEE